MHSQIELPVKGYACSTRMFWIVPMLVIAR